MKNIQLKNAGQLSSGELAVIAENTALGLLQSQEQINEALEQEGSELGRFVGDVVNEFISNYGDGRTAEVIDSVEMTQDGPTLLVSINDAAGPVCSVMIPLDGSGTAKHTDYKI